MAAQYTNWTADGQSAGPIRVVIVDDHALLREGTRALLAEDSGIVVVGMAAEGRVALRLVAELRPAVLLLDVHLPDLDGVAVTRQVRATFPDVAVLILTGYEDASYCRALLNLGVRGYLGKKISGRELASAVHAVAAGQVVLLSAAAPGTLTADTILLTEREREVLGLLAEGQPNRMIARTLAISVRTVDFHVRNVFGKLGAASRTEAIAKARRQSLIPPVPLPLPPS